MSKKLSKENSEKLRAYKANALHAAEDLGYTTIDPTVYDQIKNAKSIPKVDFILSYCRNTYL